MNDQLSTRRGAPRARNLEVAIALLVLIGGLPAVAVAGYYLWTQDMTPEVRWTLVVIMLSVWFGAAVSARQLAMRSLNLIANLLGALRGGEKVWYRLHGAVGRDEVARYGVIVGRTRRQ